MVRTVQDLLKEVVDRGGSDLHICAGSPPLMRYMGELVRLGNTPISAADSERMLDEILFEEQKKDLDVRKNIDFAYEIRHAGVVQRFRCNVYSQRCGLDGVFRVIPNQIPTLEQLNLPSSLAGMINHRQGLVLATGPSGCGKTATLAALINLLNETKGLHIITIEDPIEFIHPVKKSLIEQRQVGFHTRSFQRALRAAMREDPDVILLGELRDLETIQMAITASETGHLVFSTLHTGSAAKTIDRIIDAFPPSQQPQVRTMFSGSLRGVITQQLLPRADGWGRIPAVEILVGCTQVANIIREGKTYQVPSIMQMGKNLGMCQMDESLMSLLQQGKISARTAYEHAEEKKTFEPFIKARG